MDGVAGMNEQDVHYILSCRPAVFAILPGCVPLCGECLGLADRLHPEAPAQGRQGRRRQPVQRLQARIKEQGGAVKVATYSHLDHRGLAKALTWVYEGQSTVTTDILTFIKQVTGQE